MPPPKKVSHYIIVIVNYIIGLILTSFLMEGYFVLTEEEFSVAGYSAIMLFPLPFLLGLTTDYENLKKLKNLRLAHILLFILIPIPFFLLFKTWPLYPLIILYFYAGFSIKNTEKFMRGKWVRRIEEILEKVKNKWNDD